MITDDKNMSFERLETAFRDGSTIIDNVFLHHFMPIIQAEYVKVYLDGLMRCFGDKNSHFTKVDNIARDLNISKRTVQRAYEYFENIYVYCPDNPYADSEGNIYLVKRSPRWLKANPGEISKINSQISELKIKRKAKGLTDGESERLNELQTKIKLLLLDYRNYKDDFYKYQSTNNIIFLTNLRGLENNVIDDFINKINEVNKTFGLETDSKIKKRSKKGNKNTQKPALRERNGGVTDMTPQGGDRCDTRGDDRCDIQGDDRHDTQITTNTIINTNSVTNSISQSIGEKNNNNQKQIDRLTDIDKKVKGKGYKTYSELLSELQLGSVLGEYPYDNWLHIVKKAMWELYYYDETKIKNKMVDQYQIVTKLQNLDSEMVISAVNKVNEASKYDEIEYPVPFMKTVIFNEIDEFNGSVWAQVNHNLNNNFYSNVTNDAVFENEHHEVEKGSKIEGDNNGNTASCLSADNKKMIPNIPKILKITKTIA